MIDSTHLKGLRPAASLLKGGDSPRCIGRTKGGLNSKLHAVCDGTGRPIILLLTEGQMSDHESAQEGPLRPGPAGRFGCGRRGAFLYAGPETDFEHQRGGLGGGVGYKGGAGGGGSFQ